MQLAIVAYHLPYFVYSLVQTSDNYLSQKQFDKEKYLEQLIHAAPVAAAPDQPIPLTALATYDEWVKNQKEISLKALYSKQAEHELLQTVREFYTCKQEEGQSVSSYVLKMKSYIDQLERLGHPITLNLGVSLILVGLSKEYDSFVQNYNMHSMGKTVNELHAMLKLHKETLPMKVSAPALHAIREGKVQKIKNKKPSKAAKGVQGKGKVHLGFMIQAVGNGQRAAVEAIRNYHLCLPSGLVIVLNNCYYAPSITRGIISASRLYEDGFINRFELNNAISVSKNNIVYFSAIPISGHISKKRIEKLQHDRLLNSTDIESLEKCVSCMSRKMARKPYSHQVEIAKDLLGLIHTDHGIIAHRTPLYTPQHNRVSERRNRTLLDMVRSMMSQTTLPKSFWDYSLESDARILNMVLTKIVDKTPYEIRHGQAPKLSTDKSIGCPKETIGYSFYNPSENKVFVAQNAEFFESNLIDQDASGSLEDLEIIQEEDTNPSLDTSLNHEEDDQEIDKPQSDINPICRSTTTRHPRDRLCLYIDAEEHELGDLGEPANYKATLLDNESKKWLADMNVEMQSMKENDIRELIELPPNAKTVGHKWLFKKKTDMDGAVHTFKSRPLAKGFTQTYGVDYEETFSPVADIRAIRILIAIATFYDYEIWQMNVKTAFLNGRLSEEVYMTQPKGFVNPKYPNHICKLKRIPFHGLKQASRTKE
ncbi:retrotransposon protein, putative, ty1-copia subclass [Tanacetum coccineum]|uniref:Retrotransposon protein, putative, ty1-copia subclass n=1 Tax=Tanacetum coccineum TaxID=301880 RepID=A0ABQ5EFF4_9ASTR